MALTVRSEGRREGEGEWHSRSDVREGGRERGTGTHQSQREPRQQGARQRRGEVPVEGRDLENPHNGEGSTHST